MSRILEHDIMCVCVCVMKFNFFKRFLMCCVFNEINIILSFSVSCTSALFISFTNKRIYDCALCQLSNKYFYLQQKNIKTNDVLKIAKKKFEKCEALVIFKLCRCIGVDFDILRYRIRHSFRAPLYSYFSPIYQLVWN